jgi:hypothetical protein
MANLRLQFSDCYKEVSRFLGWGISPAGQNLTDAKAIAHAGYRKFLYPVNVLNAQQHTWSFMLKHTTLALEGEKWQYVLPVDFERMQMAFTYGDDDGYMQLRNVPASFLLNHRAITESAGAPSIFSIQPGVYNAEHGQHWEAWFYETPSQAYTLKYAYILRPQQLVNDTDYFIGSDFASEAIMESALAVAELRWDGTQGVHTAEADKLIQQLIISDTIIRPSYHGVLYDPSIRPRYSDRALPTVGEPYDE